jgi:putative restriction endonuclease
MRLFVSPTDHDWYRFLRNRRADEVNFWRPGGTKNFNALAKGEPFLFKAKAPHDAIIGGGMFAGFTRVPISMAWQAFGELNGTPDIMTFLRRVRKYRPGDESPDPNVGCILLSEPFFFPEELWLEPPSDWSRQIVSGKLYSTDESIGAGLWDAMVARIADPRTLMGPIQPADGDRPQPSAGSLADRYGTPYLTAPRLGQGTFRLGVLEAYQRKCAVTGDRIIPVLEAAHIRPYASKGPHEIPNGLLLPNFDTSVIDLCR